MKNKSLVSTVFIAWLVAGSLDILGAIFILAKGEASGTFTYISGAVLGNDTSWSTNSILFFGAGFHYFIALCWTIVYFLIYRLVKFDKLPVIISALLYGSFIFFAMRYIFIPLLGKLPAPKPITQLMLPVIIKNILILAVAFGVSLKLFARRYFKS